MAKSGNRLKAPAANYPVPQSREEAAAQIARIGALRRAVETRMSGVNDQIGRITAAVEEALLPLRQELEGLSMGVQVFAEANRAALTEGGKVKHHDFATGKISWRARPPSVALRGVEQIVAALKTLGLSRFLRTREEVDKEAMLKEPEVAKTVAGVSIATGVEDFAIEPLEIASDGGGS